MFVVFLRSFGKTVAMVVQICSCAFVAFASVASADDPPSSPVCFQNAQGGCEVAYPNCPWTFPECAPHAIGCSCQKSGMP